jgi:hypothetical protein
VLPAKVEKRKEEENDDTSIRYDGICCCVEQLNALLLTEPEVSISYVIESP